METFSDPPSQLEDERERGDDPESSFPWSNSDYSTLHDYRESNCVLGDCLCILERDEQNIGRQREITANTAHGCSNAESIEKNLNKTSSVSEKEIVPRYRAHRTYNILSRMKGDIESSDQRSPMFYQSIENNRNYLEWSKNSLDNITQEDKESCVYIRLCIN
eukprot:GHVL01004739.1.p1 GENE.GHVL01004739.1~~GHVL01004739.1.p1  ORF type:complete len:162 (+),score=17.03 GHVL01004739.1:225-710(+)